jgi:hypothetical protein
MWINFGNRAIVRLTDSHVVMIDKSTENESWLVVGDTYLDGEDKTVFSIKCTDGKLAEKCIACIASAIATDSKEAYLDSEFFK